MEITHTESDAALMDLLLKEKHQEDEYRDRASHHELLQDAFSAVGFAGVISSTVNAFAFAENSGLPQGLGIASGLVAGIVVFVAACLIRRRFDSRSRQLRIDLERLRIQIEERKRFLRNQHLISVWRNLDEVEEWHDAIPFIERAKSEIYATHFTAGSDDSREDSGTTREPHKNYSNALDKFLHDDESRSLTRLLWDDTKSRYTWLATARQNKRYKEFVTNTRLAFDLLIIDNERVFIFLKKTEAATKFGLCMLIEDRLFAEAAKILFNSLCASPMSNKSTPELQREMRLRPEPPGIDS